MQLVIEISKERYEWIRNHTGVTDYHTTEMLYEGVQNGTPLPKGYGRLIDANALVENLFKICDECGTLADNPYRDNPHIDSILDVIEHTDTIIPADTTIICPNCGIEQYNDKEYCPDCGAKLEGDE